MSVRLEYDELTKAFARILYSWKFPETMTSAVGEEERNTAISNYFLNDPAAYHALTALVATAIRARKARRE